MATSAAEMMLQCGFNGSLSMHDVEIEWRPYHRSCSCALNKSKGASSNASFQHKSISLPKKQPLNNCFMSLASSKLHSQTSFPSGSSVPYREDTNEALSHR